MTGPEAAGLSRAERRDFARGRMSDDNDWIDCGAFRTGAQSGTAPDLPGVRRKRCPRGTAKRLAAALVRIRLLSGPTACGAVASAGALLPSMLDALREDGQPEEKVALSGSDPGGCGCLDAAGGSSGRCLSKREGIDPFTQNVIRELDQGRPVIILLMLSPAFYGPSR